MVNKEKLHFLVPIIGYIIVSSIQIGILVVLNSMFIINGWPQDALLPMINIMNIIMGVTVPYVLIGLCVIGIFTTEKGENIGKSIGWIVIVMDIAVMIIGIGFILLSRQLTAQYPPILPYTTLIINLLIISEVTGIAICIGGIMILRKNFLFWE